MSLKSLFDSAKRFVVEHNPEILTGLGISGMAVSIIQAVRVTPKAMRLKEEAEDEKEDELTKLEVVQACWKPYISPAILFSLSTVCLIGASSSSKKKTAALATAYSLSEATLREYRSKIAERYGTEEEKEAYDEAVQKAPLNERPSAVIFSGSDDFWCADTIMPESYFMTSMPELKDAIAQLNDKRLKKGEVCLNDLYELIGHSYTSIGNDIGWTDQDDHIEIDVTADIMPKKNLPYVILSYKTAPHYLQ